MLKAPCHKCEDRHVGCHGSCERYKAYDAQQDIIRAKRLERMEEENAMRDTSRKVWNHWHKTKNRMKWGSGSQ